MRSNAFEEKYQILRPIGHPGSYGEVRSVLCKERNRELAVKIIRKPLSSLTKRDRTRSLLLKSETSIATRIRHRHVVDFVDVIESDKKVYLVMEQCRGGDLFDRIMKYGGRIPEPTASAIFLNLCQGISYIHNERIVHGDIKLSNIMFDNDDDRTLRLIDFGMSQYITDRIPLSEMVGTPNYQSPDVVHGSYSFGADIWSLGVVLFVMVFGFNPFDPFGLNEEAPIIHRRIIDGFAPVTKPAYGAWFPQDIAASADVKDLIGNLLHWNPEKRLTLEETLNHPWMQYAKLAIPSDRRLTSSSSSESVSTAPCA